MLAIMMQGLGTPCMTLKAQPIRGQAHCSINMIMHSF